MREVLREGRTGTTIIGTPSPIVMTGTHLDVVGRLPDEIVPEISKYI